MRDFDSGMELKNVKKNFQEATAMGDVDGMVFWAGTGIELMNEIKGAGVRICFPSYDVSVVDIYIIGHCTGTSRRHCRPPTSCV